MKKNAFTPVIIFIFFLLSCYNILGQLPNCNNPVGSWHSQQNATLRVLAVDAANGALTGTYESVSEVAGTKFQLFGWINSAGALPGSDNVTPISFGVRWTSLGS